MAKSHQAAGMRDSDEEDMVTRHDHDAAAHAVSHLVAELALNSHDNVSNDKEGHPARQRGSRGRGGAKRSGQAASDAAAAPARAPLIVPGNVGGSGNTSGRRKGKGGAAGGGSEPVSQVLSVRPARSF